MLFDLFPGEIAKQKSKSKAALKIKGRAACTALKTASIIDQQTWRFIQHLADIRNTCDHKEKDPTKESVHDLIEGVKKISKTVF